MRQYDIRTCTEDQRVVRVSHRRVAHTHAIDRQNNTAGSMVDEREGEVAPDVGQKPNACGRGMHRWRDGRKSRVCLQRGRIGSAPPPGRVALDTNTHRPDLQHCRCAWGADRGKAKSRPNNARPVLGAAPREAAFHGVNGRSADLLPRLPYHPQMPLTLPACRLAHVRQRFARLSCHGRYIWSDWFRRRLDPRVRASTCGG